MNKLELKRLIYLGIIPIIFLIISFLGFSLICANLDVSNWNIDFREGYTFSSLAILIIYYIIVMINWSDF